ncbi:MAG: MBL fold metallo-hydrolase [Thermomicrobiales bacterium]|nr:MBL fold metallo-hydrolase [Thermomicrobiales bacterium]
MRLTVLGGSAASPNTGAGCAGFLVQCSDASVVLDLGPGTLQELRRHADFRTLSAVIVSHMHVDHMLDLIALRHALAYNPIPPPGPVPVWLPPGGAALLAQVTAPFDLCDDPGAFSSTVTVQEYDPAHPLQIGDLEVRFQRTVHIVPAWAMRLCAPEGDLGYTADGGPTSGWDDLLGGVRVLIAEATLLEPGERPMAQRGSLTATEAGELAHRCGAQTLLLAHLWEERGFEAARRQAASAYPGEIVLARPGVSLQW